MYTDDNKQKHSPNTQDVHQHEEHWELVEQTEGLDKGFDTEFDSLEEDIKKRTDK